MQNETIEKIKKQISKNRILIYIKGSPEKPSCGFSAKAIDILFSYNQRFAYVDVLSHPDIRKEITKFANWPTFPQLWVNGKLIGGCDIISKLHENGKLKDIIK